MKAVVLEVPEHWLAERERMLESHRDEMWEGVLHVAPMPINAHQDFAGQLYAFLLYEWARLTGARAYGEVNVSPPGEADWRQNFRVPDLTLVGPDRFGIDAGSHLAGAPTVVVEIRSPGDETYEKLPFYAALGVPEVWVFDRDTRAVEVRVLTPHGYELAAPDADGWHVSPATGVAFRPAGAGTVWARSRGVAEELPRG